MTIKKWTATTLIIAATTSTGLWWVLSPSRHFDGRKAIEIKVINSAWTWQDGVRSAVRLPPECPPGGWQRKRSEAGYLLAIDIENGILEPHTRPGWVNQTLWSPAPQPLHPEGARAGASWFLWMFPLATPAVGAVWVSESDVQSAYQMDEQINSVDVEDTGTVAIMDTLTEASGGRLHPVWRVTCHWEPERLEMPEAARQEG